jgi:iron complex transport system permease protein
VPAALALPATYLGALVGALATAAFVYGVAARRGLAAETLLLAGVAVALFSGALVTVLQFRSDTIDLFAIVRWSMGNLSDVQFKRLYLSLPFLLAGGALVAWVARSLDVASLDDDSARGLGVDPVVVRRWAFVGTSLVITGVVAAAGPIGFVGLIVPHATRAVVGPDHRVLLPCAAFAGGAFLVGCDAVARMLFYPTDLPINVITSAIGCPAFIWILLQRSGRA